MYFNFDMATKYQEFYERMIQSNKEVFDKFNKLYNEYIKDQDNLQDRFNTEGKVVMDIIREWENKLCSRTEKAGFGNYSTNLSEKFWAEVRKTYPLIDYIGVVVVKKKPVANFNIKKISL